jgi:hypothetical protein
MDREDISVATMTRVFSPKGEKLMISALQGLSNRGFHIYAADGGSESETFIDFLKELDNAIVNLSKRGLFAQIKWSLRKAYSGGNPYILYTEPDKRQFVEQNLDEFLGKAFSFRNVAIAFPARSKSSYATFPKSQRLAEESTNKLCDHILKKDADYFYGPMLIRRELIPYLDLVTEDLGWGWRPFLMIIANRLKKRVEPVEMDLPCPIGQRRDNGNELSHRLNQLQQNIKGLSLALSIPNDQLKRQVEIS